MCVLGKDVTMDMVESLSLRSLVGKFEYTKLGWLTILAWIREVWKLVIRYIPQVVLLANGWIIFQFLYEEDRQIINRHLWVIGQGSLVLSRWHVGFDPQHEKLVKRHLWVILPDFPVHHWNLKGFMGKANAPGKFILMEDNQLLGFERVSPRVLVESDVIEGLLAELEVLWEGGSFIQRLDY